MEKQTPGTYKDFKQFNGVSIEKLVFIDGTELFSCHVNDRLISEFDLEYLEEKILDEIGNKLFGDLTTIYNSVNN
jgi:hypothetical protein